MPTNPLTLSAAEAVTTFATMPEAFVAAMVMAPPLRTLLESTWALVFVRMTLVASAPAPLRLAAMPAAIAAAADAAAAVERIVAW